MSSVTPADGLEPDASLATLTPEELPEIPKYNVLSKLAVGGMAEIFVAQRQGSSELCVIKRLLAQHAEDPVVGNRFLREARVASELNHPNIARLTDAAKAGGVFYLAMEYIPGQDVESMMFKLMEQKKMLPPQLSATCALEVLSGLHYAHEYRSPDGRHLEIVHRDLSPRNVMITYDGDVRIIDFGLARTNLGDFRTSPGMVLGTLRYMSPEQATAEPVDRRSDIYSWGVVIYEMLSGRPLVLGSNANEVLRAVVTQEPPPLTSINPTMPAALDPVLARALAKDRRHRYANALEFKIDLEAALVSVGRADPPLIGQFVRELYPAEYTRTRELVERVERGEIAEITQILAAGDLTRAQVFEPTLVGAGPVEPASLPSVVIAPPEEEYTYEPEVPDPSSSALYPETLAGAYGETRVLPPRRRTPVALVVAMATAALMLSAALALVLTRPEPVPVARSEARPPPARPQASPDPPAPRLEARAPAPPLPVEPAAPPRRAAPTREETAPRKSAARPDVTPPAPEPPARPRAARGEFFARYLESPNDQDILAQARQRGLDLGTLERCRSHVFTDPSVDAFSACYDRLVGQR